MKTLLISDSIGLGIMEVRPEPAWLVRLTALRNKDLLAPDYGAMHVAAYLKGTGHNLDVINLSQTSTTAPGFSWNPTPTPARYPARPSVNPVSYTHLRAHETRHDLVCSLLLEKK